MYGVYAEGAWEPDELQLLLRAVRRMGRPQAVRQAIGGVTVIKREGGGGETYPFWPWPPWKRIVLGERTLHQEPAWLGEVAVVHELAHAWDAQTASLLQRIFGGEGRLVRGMREFVGEEPGPTWYGSGDPQVTPASCPACEEWAESVAAYLYPEYMNFWQLIQLLGIEKQDGP